MSRRPSQPVRAVAFLRGINVGGHRVSKEQLIELVSTAAGVGATDVSTFQASGNVLLTLPGAGAVGPDGVEGALEASFAAGLGYAVDTFLRTAAEVASLAAHEPFPGTPFDEDAGDALHVTLLKAPPPAAVVDAVAALSNDADVLAVQGRELWWLRRGRLTDTTLPKGALDRAMKPAGPGTARNTTTIRRLAALVAP